jgi:hypothetical protein
MLGRPHKTQRPWPANGGAAIGGGDRPHSATTPLLGYRSLPRGNRTEPSAQTIERDLAKADEAVRRGRFVLMRQTEIVAALERDGHDDTLLEQTAILHHSKIARASLSKSSPAAPRQAAKIGRKE